MLKLSRQRLKLSFQSRLNDLRYVTTYTDKNLRVHCWVVATLAQRRTLVSSPSTAQDQPPSTETQTHIQQRVLRAHAIAHAKRIQESC